MAPRCPAPWLVVWIWLWRYTSQFIELTDVNFWSLHPLVYTPANAANTSGTLTVTDGTHTAHIKFVGTYTLASFTHVNDGIGGVKITDPPVGQQSSIAVGAHPTLAYFENSNAPSLGVTEGRYVAALALFGN
jgi:hypothetical protein